MKYFGEKSFYMGLTDHEQEGHWKWSSTNRISAININADHLDCAQPITQDPNKKKVRFIPIECSTKLTIICEKSLYFSTVDVNRLPN